MNSPNTFNLRSMGVALFLLISPLAIGQINCADARAAFHDEKPLSAEEHFDDVMSGLLLEDEIEADVLPDKQVAWEKFAAPDDFVPVDFVTGQLPLLAPRNNPANENGSVFLRDSDTATHERAWSSPIATLLLSFPEVPGSFTVSSAFATTPSATVRFISLTNLTAIAPLEAADLVTAFPSTLRTVCQGKAARFESMVAVGVPGL